MTVFALGVQRNPEIAQAVMQNDIELFQRLLQQQHQRRLDLKHQSQQPSVSGILCVMEQPYASTLPDLLQSQNVVQFVLERFH